jgi:LPPG:FO 2-phospho-L-lactate transferase
MQVTALAGGVGAGKFLRGLIRAVPPENVTVIVNTGDDIVLHGLHVSPDVDSVTYWLAGLSDRERGWGVAGETFRAAERLRELGAPGSWFSLGDVDLATHLFRTDLMALGMSLSEVTARVAERCGVRSRVLPMTDDRVTTRVEAADETGTTLDLHFQEYWVQRGARDEVRRVRYEGAERAAPGPAVLDAIERADVVVICPSNPVASIGPILAVPGIRGAVANRRDVVVGISPIVGGVPLRGMADKLLPVVGIEVDAASVAGYYDGLLNRWIIDRRDTELLERAAALVPVAGVFDTVMDTDSRAEALARYALDTGGPGG